MDWIWMLIWFVTYAVGAVLYEIYIVHMFQQNSYKPREYREWMQVHRRIPTTYSNAVVTSIRRTRIVYTSGFFACRGLLTNIVIADLHCAYVSTEFI